MKRIAQLAESGMSVKQAVAEAFGEHRGLVSRTMFDGGQVEKRDQVDFLRLVEADLKHRKDGEGILLFVANDLYTTDVLEADAFEQWWMEGENEEGTGVRGKMKQFMDVLLAETESESGDDEDDDVEESEDD